jgi:ABC-type multidrug transport system fused ATPase/permease subunit
LSIYRSIKYLFSSFSKKRKIQLIILIIFSISTTIIDLISIAAVGPFMMTLISPEIPLNYLYNLNYLTLSENINDDNITFLITLFFVILLLCSTILRLIVLYLGTKLSFLIGAEISSKCFETYLNKPYNEIINIHTSEIINDVLNNTNAVIYQVLNPLVMLLNGFMLILLLTITLCFLYPRASIIAFLFLFLTYSLIHIITKGKVRKNGEKIIEETSKIIKSIQESIGGIRDVILDGSQNQFVNRHSNADINLRKLQRNNLFISLFPRIGIEAIAMILVAIVGYFMSKNIGMTLSLPLLAVVVMVGQRLLPALQQCYVSINSIISSASALDKVNILLFNKNNQTPGNYKKIDFNNKLSLNNVEVRLGPAQKQILNKVNLTIFKGQKIGIIGKTGSGKSTLVDNLMGLLLPNSGYVMIDSVVLDDVNIKHWRKNISHVPQHIFLADASIKSNIAYGVHENEIIDSRIRCVLDKTELTEFVNSLPQGINTNIGEGGIFLSGGQRQRLGIARALYKNSKFLVLDEATSALDSNTEKKIMDNIYKLGNEQTVIIIAHRLTTLQGCDQIYEVDQGELRLIGTYCELINDV